MELICNYKKGCENIAIEEICGTSICAECDQKLKAEILDQFGVKE